MEVKYICTYWGQEGITGDDFVKKVKDAGYDGAEINFPEDPNFINAIKEAQSNENFILVAQQWLPLKNETVSGYIHRFKERLHFLAGLNPVFINSHTGKDFFSFEDNCRVIDEAYAFEKETGISIVHETHRGRFNFSSFANQAYFDKYPDLRINADFSHWCNVSESFLDDQPENLKRAIKHSHYIHARVGHTQSAQVNDPFAPEWKETLEIFVGWWKQILAQAKERGEKIFYICPEFGPYPYMPYLPYTFMPVQDQWDINVKMMNFLKEELK